MLKRLIIIFLLLTPTALPATNGVCQMMLAHLNGDESGGVMSCCPADGSGRCMKTMSGHSAPAQAEMTEASSASETVGIAVCNCGLSNSSIPPGLPSDRLTATDSKASPGVLP